LPIMIVLLAGSARATSFYLDASKANATGCGTQATTACGTYRYWFSQGCDADGCGNNVAAGDTIYFKGGTYKGDGAGGYLGIPFDGSASAPITLACSDAPGTCIISGSGVTAIAWCALFGIGLAPGQAYCATDPAS